MTIDWTKPVRTVGSKLPVKIISQKGLGTAPIIGYIMFPDQHRSEIVRQWTIAGTFKLDVPAGLRDFDLENVPPEPVTAERWIIWRQSPGGVVTCEVSKHDPRDKHHQFGVLVEGVDVNGVKITVQHIKYVEKQYE